MKKEHHFQNQFNETISHEKANVSGPINFGSKQSFDRFKAAKDSQGILKVNEHIRSIITSIFLDCIMAIDGLME